MRISVYLKHQDPLLDSAPHETSRNFAALLLRNVAAHPIGQNAIQLTNDESWQEVKNRFRGVPAPENDFGLLPPLDWYYPWVGIPDWMLRIYRSHEFAA